MGTGDLESVRILSAVLFFIFLSAANADGFIGRKNAVWMQASSNGKEKKLEYAETQMTFPGSYRIFTQRAPATMRLSKDDFMLKDIRFKLRTYGSKISPKILFYLTDKDGNWYQSQKEYKLKANGITIIKVPLDTFSQAMRPIGHRASWNAQSRIMTTNYGLNIYSPDKGTVRLELISVDVEKRKDIPKLQIINWQMPRKLKHYQVTEGDFSLSREYFNPFDPDNIEINVRVRDKDNKETLFPAYYTVAHTRKLKRDSEVVSPVGRPYWAYKFTPRKTGKYYLRLEIFDRSGKKMKKIISPEIELNVVESKNKGFVQVSPKDTRYFEFSNGEIFFPLGLNIHSPKDNRYEERMKDDKIFDLGATSYERYFEAMNRNGLNSCEVWMASWSMGIEWTNKSQNYYGLGRYNLANATQLDAVMESARKNDIYIHLTLDNHGKLSSHTDQEWHNSPYFKRQPYGIADRACVDSTIEFFSNPEAIKFNHDRNRYIAARWGAYPNIFGVELWSEVDLVTDHATIYDNGISAKWHNDTAKDFKKWSQGKQPVTTHTCGTFTNTLKIEKLFDLPEIDFIVSDAYKRRISMVDYLKEHIRQLKHLPEKPRLITEFGLVSNKEIPLMRADLHSALWGSLFFGFAGAPLNWWHEFIHTRKHYHHFKGLSKYLKGYDPRGKKFVSAEHYASSKQQRDDLIESISYYMFGREKKPLKVMDFIKKCESISIMLEDKERIRAISFGNSNEEFVWVFKNKYMELYPSDEEIEDLELLKQVKVRFQKEFKKGIYKIDCFDTISGDIVKSMKLKMSGKRNVIVLPPFKIDIALKIKLLENK
jgi:hypothetical protein